MPSVHCTCVSLHAISSLYLYESTCHQFTVTTLLLSLHSGRVPLDVERVDIGNPGVCVTRVHHIDLDPVLTQSQCVQSGPRGILNGHVTLSCTNHSKKEMYSYTIE